MPSRLQRGWKGCRSFWNSKTDLKDQYSYELWHTTTWQNWWINCQQVTGLLVFIWTRTTLCCLLQLLFVSICQDPPEPSAAVRQLFASFPAVNAQCVQDGGLCCGKNQLLRGPGGSELWTEAFPLWRKSPERPQLVLWLWFRQVSQCHALQCFSTPKSLNTFWFILKMLSLNPLP